MLEQLEAFIDRVLPDDYALLLSVLLAPFDALLSWHRDRLAQKGEESEHKQPPPWQIQSAAAASSSCFAGCDSSPVPGCVPYSNVAHAQIALCDCQQQPCSAWTLIGPVTGAPLLPSRRLMHLAAAVPQDSEEPWTTGHSVHGNRPKGEGARQAAFS